MCLAIPMKVVSIKEDTAVVEFGDISREVNIQFINNVKKGDYVIVHAGVAIEKLDKKEAEEWGQVLLFASDFRKNSSHRVHPRPARFTHRGMKKKDTKRK